jgi:Gaa1-like, GPI transamidase component
MVMLQAHHMRGSTISSQATQWADAAALQERYTANKAAVAANTTSSSTDSNVQWLCEELQHIGLPCNQHNYQYHRPDIHKEEGTRRTSVYTVLTPQTAADHKECIILTAAMLTSDATGTGAALTGGVSLSLALLRDLKERAAWLSVNVLLLFTDVTDTDSTSAQYSAPALWPDVQQFIDDYNTDTLTLIARAQQPYAAVAVQHAGHVRAALCLDFAAHSSEQWSAVRILTTGANGALPNLDLPTVAAHFFESRGVGLDTCTASAYAAAAYSDTAATEVPAADSSAWLCTDVFTQVHTTVKAVLVRLQIVNEGDRIDRYIDRFFYMLGNAGSVAIGASGPHTHFLR